MSNAASINDLSPEDRARFEAFQQRMQKCPEQIHGLLDPKTKVPLAIDVDGTRRKVLRSQSMEDPRPQGIRMTTRNYWRIWLDDSTQIAIFKDSRDGLWYRDA